MALAIDAASGAKMILPRPDRVNLFFSFVRPEKRGRPGRAALVRSSALRMALPA